MSWREHFACLTVDKGWKSLQTASGVEIGQLLMGDDGYWQWWPTLDRSGYIPTYMLRAIADCVDELNKEWDEQLKPELKEPT